MIKHNILMVFSKYATVGVLNTFVHIFCFALLFNFGFEQWMSNSIAFLVSSSISYIINAKYTFNSNRDLSKYIFYMIFMGCNAALFGMLGDMYVIPGMLTLLMFAMFSFISGFVFSNYVLFRS